MARFTSIFIFLIISISGFSQNKNLSDYSFVIVPMEYEFLNRSDQYELNSMTKFYLEKAGFNTFFSNENPNAQACDGLYLDVEKLSAFMGTKLQVVLKDCQGNEVYRSIEGKSKLKDYERSYQDALRKSVNALSSMQIKQKEIEPKADKNLSLDSQESIKTMDSYPKKDVNNTSESAKTLPTSRYSNYSSNDKSFLLRMTEEGYSLYEETTEVADGLRLVGKIIVFGEAVKYMDDAGAISDVSFDAAGNMTVKNGNFSTIYNVVD